MTIGNDIGLTAAALLLEGVFGYPAFLLRTIGHPVMWIGTLIAATESRLNRQSSSAQFQKLLGVGALVFWLICVGVCGGIVTRLLGTSIFGELILVLLATSLLAQRSLYEHVRAVATALEHGGLELARAAVGRIVGRNPANLDEAGVARAAIESLAENFSDGIVAPAFWLAAAGLAGAMLYKTINTADSMIGHRTPRFANFGWASARLDDLVNLPPARLAALLFAAAAAFGRFAPAREVWHTARRDASKHLSPNAGWRRPRWPGRLVSSLAVLGSMARLSLTAPSWATAGGTRTPKTFVARLNCFDAPRAIQILAYAALALAFI